MKRFSIVPTSILMFDQLTYETPVMFTREEIYYLWTRIINDAASALLPPGDGTVHAAPFAPKEARVDLIALGAKLKHLEDTLFKKN